MKKIFGFVGIISISLLASSSLLAQESNWDSTAQKAAIDTTTQRAPLYYSLQKRFYKDANDTLRIDKFGFTVKPSINFGAGLRMRRHKNKYPFAYEHSLIAYYAVNRGSFYIEHESIWKEIVGKWNLSINNRLYIPNSVRFAGVGNETTLNEDLDRPFYNLYSTEFHSSIGINRLFNKVHFVELSPFYQNIDIQLREDRFLATYLPYLSAKDVERKHFMGATTTYGYTKINNPLSPTKGFAFNVAASYVKNVKSTDQTDEDFTRYTSSATVYLPLSPVITLALRAGGAALQGDPEFYQLNRLGGNQNLRGFRRERFYGKHSFYNNNDLRVLWPTQNRYFDGKIGFVAFIDQGRVWQPGEESNTWHVGYGGGPVVQIFNQLLLNFSYGLSKEDRVLHLRLGFLF